MYKPFNINQIKLMLDITRHIEKDHPGSKIDIALQNRILQAVNSICDEAKRERIYADRPMTPEEWLASDDTGTSSRFMLSVISGILAFSPYHVDIPSDAGDLGRCIRMVKCCQLEEHVHKMSECGDTWKRIADNWDDLNKMHELGKFEQIYDFLKS